MDEAVDQITGPDGEQIELRKQGAGYQLLIDGKVSIDSAERRSEGELARLGLGPLRDRNDINVLLGGLGMGHLLRALLDMPGVVRVDVVERLAKLIEWNRGPLAEVNRGALSDPRVHVHHAELGPFLRAVKEGAIQGVVQDNGGYYYAVMMDVDNGPSALSRPDNAGLYDDEGLALLEDVLRPGGVASLWSAQREPELVARLSPRYQNIAEMVIPVEIASQPDQSLDYIYRFRRRAIAKPDVPDQPNGKAH